MTHFKPKNYFRGTPEYPLWLPNVPWLANSAETWLCGLTNCLQLFAKPKLADKKVENKEKLPIK